MRGTVRPSFVMTRRATATGYPRRNRRYRGAQARTRANGACGASYTQRTLAPVQQAESDCGPLPFDVAEARAFGRVALALRRSGRSVKPRAYDVMIAATALANAWVNQPSDTIYGVSSCLDGRDTSRGE